MAESSTDWTLDGLDNPLLVQERLLDRFENVTGNVVVDANNPACVLMEGFASVASGLVRSIEDNVRPAIYPARANTAIDLYKHLSDYDYVDIFASPATTTLLLVVDKTYIMNNSVAVAGASYKKLVIPRTTVFTVGEHTFGIYYPIEIRSNSDTGRFSVVYDTTERNPLKTLSTNVLEYDLRKFDNLDLVYIKIPVYQFQITSTEEVLVNGTGFKKNIDYSDKFYAIRCTAPVLQNPGHEEQEDDIWETQELALCVSGQSYDPETPTVIFTPDLENNTCNLEIPYVYFSNGLIQGTLHVDIYTTEGAMNYQVPDSTTENTTIDMFSLVNDDQLSLYVEPFRQMPALQIIPQSTNIIGGADGMDFETLKRRVITGTLTSKTLQTPDDIDAYFANHGYISTLLRDGVTDRVFLVHSTVRNSADEVVSADCVGTLFDFTGIDVVKDYETIKDCGSGIYTVYPSTLYAFDSTRGICTPMTTQERRAILDLSAADKVKTFNNNIYTLSPFHLQVDTNSKYPTTITYDMDNAEIVQQEFIKEREGEYEQLILNMISLARIKEDVKNYYRFSFRISRAGMDDVKAVVSSGETADGQINFQVIVGMKNDDGKFYYATAEYDGRTDDFDIYHLDILSDYVFHQANNNHTVVLYPNIYQDDGTGTKLPIWSSDFFLPTTEVRVMLALNENINNIKERAGESGQALETDYTGASYLENITKYYALSEYRIVCKFGAVVNELDQRINLAYSDTEYQKYETTKFLTLDQPIYKTLADGCLDIVSTYAVTLDTVFIANRNYYKKVGDVYTLMVPKTAGGTEGDYTIGAAITSVGYTVYNYSVKIHELYPAGTLTCITKTAAESMILNNLTVQNYLGLKAIEQYTDEGEIKTREITVDPSDVNKVLAFEAAPIIPRFNVTATTDAANGEQPAVGTYELLDPQACTGLSSPNDVWAKTGTDLNNYGNNISVNDALLYVFQNILTRSDHIIDNTDEKREDALQNVTAPKGTFLLVINDLSGYDTTAPEINEIPASKRDDPLIKLYYCAHANMSSGTATNPVWVCVAQAINPDPTHSPVTALTTYINAQISKSSFYQVSGGTFAEGVNYYKFVTRTSSYVIMVPGTAAEVTAGTADYVIGTTIPSEPKVFQLQASPEDRAKTFGYAYINHCKAKTLDTKVEYDQSFMVFLCTKKNADGYTVPDFTKRPVQGETELTIVNSLSDFVDGRHYYEMDPVTGVATGVSETYAKANYTSGKIYYTESYDSWWSYAVNRWPWDNLSWQIRTDAVINVRGTLRNLNAVCCADDNEYTTIIDAARLHKYCAYMSNQYHLDSSGNLQPIKGGEARIQYLIDMLQLDAKLAQTTINQSSKEYPDSITDVLRSIFDEIGTARDHMFTNTRLFFNPRPTLAKGTFNVGDGRLAELPLDITVDLTIHVSQSTADDDSLIQSIRKDIIKIIDDSIEQGYLSLTEVAKTIMTDLSDLVYFVDVGGINGDPTLQTLRSVDDVCIVHLKHTLVQASDEQTIDVDRGLNLTIVVNER